MSISKEKRQHIKRYMLEHIDNKDTEFIKKTINTFSISKTTAYNYIKAMLQDNIIEKCSEGYPYSLKNIEQVYCYQTSDDLQEDQIFVNDINKWVNNLQKNVYNIWRYAFTEMMNNAIDHAEAKEITCLVNQNILYTEITIMDDGIGIFKKIQAYYKENLKEDISLNDAILLLFAGKFTTDRSHHSGEGIFFTSRAADSFYIYSDRKIFNHEIINNTIYSLNEDVLKQIKGTVVNMKLSNTSNKNLTDIFNMYTDVDKGFFRTRIPIAHVFPNGYPVSRSEAKRLGETINQFEEVTLDFSNVETLGQAFTHELFVVFQNANPNINIKIINATSEVASMIQRVKNS